MDKYTVLKIIGQGAYENVCKGKCNISGNTVAIKVIKNLTNKDYYYVQAIREI